MKKLYTVFVFITIFITTAGAQSFKFYYSDYPRFLKPGSTTDTLKLAFTGGANAPQFSNIDVNMDGKKDVFIFDRSSNKSMVFLWDGKGFVHAPQYEGMMPEMSDWVQLKDYNGDGKEDIFTRETFNKTLFVDTIQTVYPDGMRILRNTTTQSKDLKFKQLNNQLRDTGGTYPPPGGVRMPLAVAANRIDMPGIGDMDGDGDLDIVTFTPASYAPLYYEDFVKNKHGIPYSPDTAVYIIRDDCWAYTWFDASSGRNRFKTGIDRNQFFCTWEMYGKAAKHAGTTELILDANQDGVSDVIYADVGFTNFVLLINGRNQNSQGRDSIIAQDTAFPSNTTPANFILFPAAYYVDIDADGKSELLVSTNAPSGVKNADNVWVYDNAGTQEKPVFNYRGNNVFFYDETIDLGMRTVPALVDIDGDGDDDLLVATSGRFDVTQNLADKIVWYENVSPDTLQTVFALRDTNFLQLSRDTAITGLCPAFADLNGDGKPDMICGNEAGELLYYENQGSGNTISFSLVTRKLGGIDVGSFAAPNIVDLDRDGLKDLVVGNKQGYVKYFRNTGSISAPQFSAVPTIDSLGFVKASDTTYNYDLTTSVSYEYAAPFVYDLDQDGNYEMLLGTGGGKVYLYTGVSAVPGATFNIEQNIFVDYSDSDNARPVRFGSRSTPCIGELDHDGKPDLIIGNIRGGLSCYASVNTGVVDAVNTITKAAPDFMVYPNPASGSFTISTSNLRSDVRYHIYSIVGEELLSGNVSRFHSGTTVSLETLSPGMYFITLEGAQYRSGKKFIVR